MDQLIPQRPLSPQEKKKYLLQKYTKRDYKIEDLESCKKYAVYFNPAIDKIKDWTLLCVTETREQSLKEILWRKMYHIHGDSELIIENDSRFETFKDETKHVDNQGNTIEPGQELMTLNYNMPGDALQVIANSLPEQQSKNGFRGIGYYTQFNLDYKGFYKIVEYYEI